MCNADTGQAFHLCKDCPNYVGCPTHVRNGVYSDRNGTSYFGSDGPRYNAVGMGNETGIL